MWVEHHSLVRVDGINLESLKGRHVIIVEDIVDTGNTMQALVPMLESCGAASVVVCFLPSFHSSLAFCARRILL